MSRDVIWLFACKQIMYFYDSVKMCQFIADVISVT